MKTNDINSGTKPDNYYDNTRANMFQFIPPNVKKTLEFGCANGNFSELTKNRLVDAK